MTLVDEVLGHLDGAKRSGNGWTARCPAHDDRIPSLSIRQADDGRVLLHCHAGCSFEAICAAAGVDPSDLRPATTNGTAGSAGSASPRHSFPTAEAAIQVALQAVRRRRRDDWATRCVYVYESDNGSGGPRVVRFEPPDGSNKEFRPISPDGSGGWRIGDPDGKWPLYGLPKLAGEGTIYIVEGEKAAEAASGIGLACSTSAHGARSASKTDWSPLAGREVVVLPDNDGPGRQYAEAAAQTLLSLEPAAQVKIVYLPDLPEHGDIVEFISKRKAAGASPDQIRDEIHRRAETAPSVGSVGPAQGGSGTSVGFVGRALGRSQHAWPQPQDLPDGRPPVMPLDPGLLPPALRGWAEDIAERFQCAFEYLAITILVGLSAVLGRKVAIRPKRLDDWTVVANLWGIGIGRPGLMKTPAIREALRVLERLERRYREDFENQEFEFKAAQLVAERRRKKFTLVRSNVAHDIQVDMEDARECIRGEPQAPARRRLLVNDSTVEKLGEILRDNPNGVLVYRDELIGFLRSLDKEGQEGARSFFLEAWDGAGSYVFDRIGRGTIDIPNATVSVIGGIQPGPLQEYLAKAIRGGTGDDGLMQRFQLAVWPDTLATWTNVDREPDRCARDRAFEIYKRLEQSTAAEMAADVDGDRTMPFLRFTPAAQEAFDAWRQALEVRIRSDEDHPAIESHLCKYRSLLPSIALIDHLVGVGRGPVEADSVERAIRWTTVLESHARRIYAEAVVHEIVAARRIAHKIRQQRLGTRFAARDVYRNGWAGLTDREVVAAALQVLADHGWVRAEINKDTGGAPSTAYVVNPHVLAGHGPSEAESGRGAATAPGAECPGEPLVPVEAAGSDEEWGVVR